MGHRVFGHESLCARLHGHGYTAEITCAAERLDRVGRVVDFGVVKEIVGGFVAEYWDHRTMLMATDPLAALLNGDPCLVAVMANPTAENIAAMLYEKSSTLLAPHGVEVVRVRVWETPNCFAEAP